MSRWTPVAPEALPERIAEWLGLEAGLVRVAVDGAPCTAPDDLAAALCGPLRRLGRPAAHVRADTFWRDASLRFEHGREDLESFPSWLDAGALRREVLDAAACSARYLPSLRDPTTNRSTREPSCPVQPDQVLVISGALLLGQGLPFDRVVHLTVSPAALARRTAPEQAWTLPAYAAYEQRVRPAENADVVVKLDDPRRPALRWR